MRKFEAAWNELIESGTAKLEGAGATVKREGTSVPPGPDPAASAAVDEHH